jgi:Domain of unknown function (DUF4157)
MSDKATVGSVPKAKSPPIPAPPHSSRQLAGISDSNPFLSLQQALGNQGMLQLLECGAIQAKLRLSQPGDADEVEADRVANRIVAAAHSPRIQRKCACEGSGHSCTQCQEEESATIHRSVVPPLLRSSTLAIQRAPATDAPANAPDKAGNPPQPSPTPARTLPLIVEDDARDVAAHQMRKSAFLSLLRSETCSAADAALKSVGHTTQSCPYIQKWLAFYEKQSNSHIERALRKYAPETASARSAREAIRLVVLRVERAAVIWAKTGRISGLPEDLASQLPGQGGFLGAIHQFASTSVGGAILGFIGGHPSDESAGLDAKPAASDYHVISRKPNGNGVGADAAPVRDPASVRSRLGAGHSLDSRVQSQMSTAFGRDFSGVRVHTDSRAATLSSNLQARAFTIGSDVAFASGEYKPGTLIGDALIAHELAHVVQQSGTIRAPSPMPKAEDGTAHSTDPATSQLEHDADLSAIGVVASIWTGTKRGLADLRANAVPRLRSGLRLQRCGRHDPVPAKYPEIPATQEELGKHAVACMIAANKGPHTKTSGIWYAAGYKSSFPDAWDDDYERGYANPEYWERIGWRQWRLKKKRSASAGVKAWLKGLTIAECHSTAIVAEVDSIRAAIGDARFDELYGSEDKAVEPRLELGQDGSNALPEGTLRHTDTSGGVGSIGHRPAQVGEWHYFYNHPKYLLKHPGGVYQGENALLRQETAPNGDQLWEGLGQRKVTERRMYMNMMADYNRPRDAWDKKKLDHIRDANGGVLPPEYDPASGIFPDKLNSYEEILNEPPYEIDGTVRKGGYEPASGKHLDPERVQELRVTP